MAVLSSAPGSPAPARARVVLGLVLASVAGCMVFDALGEGEQPFAFSHKRHVVDESIDCGDCHLNWDSEDEPGMPALAQCQLCHKKIDAEKPEDRRVTALFDGKTYRGARASDLPDEVVFSHLKHVTTPEACGDCHHGIVENEQVDASVGVTMDDCMRCHAQKQVANECATCHREVGPDWKPGTHAHQWLRLHGKAVRAQGDAVADRCDLCHAQSTCTTCHQDVLPESHNHFFRRRGHGLIARMDRETCAACHRADSCDRCHSEVLPQNHTGQFGMPRNMHCVRCHVPLQASDCFTCHKSTPSHAMATPLPPGHLPGMNCRQCHGLTAPLQHVDNGMPCTVCHR